MKIELPTPCDLSVTGLMWAWELYAGHFSDSPHTLAYGIEDLHIGPSLAEQFGNLKSLVRRSWIDGRWKLIGMEGEIFSEGA
ncbi:hypothetical protein LCGC14_1233000 [marine sediment metagenome]|uniref:Uncharacterized protein n=1 Tax=marine sediment metagenome TaxID=412755 RepID=A0A0F9PC94_9ZZZZ